MARELDSPCLIPTPKRIRFSEGAGFCELNGVWSAGENLRDEQERPAVEALEKAFRSQGLGNFRRAANGEKGAIRLKRSRADFMATRGPEAYRLAVSPEGIALEGPTPQARFYAAQTLAQLMRRCGRRLPALVVEDWPDYPNRGYMLDVSRGKAPRLRTLFELAELLASLKYNHLQLYVEHTFAFRAHPEIGRGHSPLSGEDVRRLDAHCRRLHIRLVPNLQSFGHAAHILKHRRYAHLAESDFRGGWTLSPAEPETYELLREMYAEFLPNFSEREPFNVDCDEPWDLGKGKSAEIAKERGLGALYAGHIRKLRALTPPPRRRLMIWADVALRCDDALQSLPRDAVLLNWKYDAPQTPEEYDDLLKPIEKAGLEQWVCPGTSAWNGLFFRMNNARSNIREFARAGRRHGAKGLLLTDWGDNGHFSSFGASLWPIAFAAGCAWNAESEADAEFDRRFASLILEDHEGKWIEPLRLLGGLNEDFAIDVANLSPERVFLTGDAETGPYRIWPWNERELLGQIKPSSLKRALEHALEARERLAAIRPDTARLRLIRDEWSLAAELSALACRRALLLKTGTGDAADLRRDYRRAAARFEKLWLARNRKGDLGRNLEELRRAI